MLKTIPIICILFLFAALGYQNTTATNKCEQINKNNQTLLNQCKTLGL